MDSKEFDLMYSVEDHHWWYRGLRHMLDQAWTQYVPPRPGIRLLDIGCGTGANLRAFGARATAIGIDFAPKALALCQERNQSLLAAGSALDLPIQSECADAVISCDVLCHLNVSNVATLLREIYRVLKPGGIFLLNLPAYQWLSSSHDDAVLNARRFTRGEVVRDLEAQSFTVLRATYWNTILFPPALCVRLWRKCFGAAGSDLTNVPGPFENRVCGLALAAERKLLRQITLPAGLSIFAVARKP